MIYYEPEYLFIHLFSLSISTGIKIEILFFNIGMKISLGIKMLNHNIVHIQETGTYYDFLREIQKYFNNFNMTCSKCKCGLKQTDMILRIINSDYKKVLIVKFNSMNLDCDCKVKDWVCRELECQS